jgi:nucleotidyltransferase substrate binding protein (TIGR01987 family)
LAVLDLTALQRATHSLEESITVLDSIDLSESNAYNRTIVAGVVQHFEFTYELSWKFMKRWLSNNLSQAETEGLSRRALFRLAHEYRLISSVEQWMEFHQARNLTSHTYNENVALEVSEFARLCLPQAILLLERLNEQND